jgi:hypothetical protein
MRKGTERSSPSDRYRRHESIILIGLLSIIVTTLTTALTLAMVYRGEAFERAAVLLQSTPHPSPLPKERELVPHPC